MREPTTKVFLNNKETSQLKRHNYIHNILFKLNTSDLKNKLAHNALVPDGVFFMFPRLSREHITNSF